MSETRQREPDLTILVDMDGVLVDFMGGWVSAWNKANATKAEAFEWHSFYVEECYKDLAPEKDLTAIFHVPGFFYDLDPLPGAIEAFNQMARCGLDLSICTAPTTSKSCWQEKADWVEHYLGKEWLRKLIITKDKTMIHGDYLIDDKPEITGSYTPTWKHILFDQPYNQEDRQERHRISWKTWPSLLMYHAGIGR